MNNKEIIKESQGKGDLHLWTIVLFFHESDHNVLKNNVPRDYLSNTKT